MTSTEPYTAAATQARQATDSSIEAFRTGTKTFTDQFEQFTIPTVDLTEPVARYFEYVQKAVDLNRDLATMWVELVTELSGSIREQAQKITGIVKDQTETVADLTGKQAEMVEQAAQEQARKVEQDRRGQELEKEREQAMKAREPYQGLTKAELSDQLAERDLPKTGTVEELTERLINADSR